MEVFYQASSADRIAAGILSAALLLTERKRKIILHHSLNPLEYIERFLVYFDKLSDVRSDRNQVMSIVHGLLVWDTDS